MRFIITTAVKDLRRRLADPVALLLWIGIPVLIGSLMGLASGGSSGTAPKAKVLLVDQDGGLLSKLVERASGGESPLLIEPVELEAGRAQLDRGEASALLVLPDGFTEAVLKELPTQLTLVKNPSQQVLPGIAEGALDMLVEVVFYAHRLFGEALALMAQDPPADRNFLANAVVASIAIDINERMQQLETTLFPPALTVEPEPVAAATGEAKPKQFSLGAFLLPSILFMSLLFIAQGTSEDIWKEREQGTLRRLASTPVQFTVFLFGKYLAGALLMLVVAAVGLLVGTALLGVEPQQPVVALIWCAFSGTVMLVLFGWVQLLAKNQRAGNVLTTIILFPLMMIGGSFFPLESMPRWMAQIGRWTPNGQALTALSKMLRGELAAVELLTTTALLGVPALLLFYLSVRRLRGSFVS